MVSGNAGARKAWRLFRLLGISQPFTCNIRQFGRLFAGHVVIVEVHHDDPFFFFLQRWTEEETLADLETLLYGMSKNLSLLLCQAGEPIASWSRAGKKKGQNCGIRSTREVTLTSCCSFDYTLFFPALITRLFNKGFLKLRFITRTELDLII